MFEGGGEHHSSFDMLRAHGTLPVIEEVEIEHFRVGGNLGCHAVCFDVDGGWDLLPLAVLPFAGVASEGEFGFRD